MKTLQNTGKDDVLSVSAEKKEKFFNSVNLGWFKI